MNKPVEIRGFGFTTPPPSNQVAFNGTSAAVVSGTGSSLFVTVPAGATTGTVTVTNANGTATSPQGFTVLVPPIITGVDPPQVPKGGTKRVLIEGFNLQNASSVQFAQAGLTATIQPGTTASTVPINLTITAAVVPSACPVEPFGSFAAPFGPDRADFLSVMRPISSPVHDFSCCQPGSLLACASFA